MGQASAGHDSAVSIGGSVCCTSRTSANGSPRSREEGVAPAWLFPQFQHAQQQQQQQQQQKLEQKQQKQPSLLAASSSSHCCGARGGDKDAFEAGQGLLPDNDQDQAMQQRKERVSPPQQQQQQQPQQPQQQPSPDLEAVKDRAWTIEDPTVPKLLQPRAVRGDSGGAINGAKRGLPGLCNMDCVTERTGGFGEALSGDRLLTRKLVSLQALREEERQLTEALSLIDSRLESVGQGKGSEPVSRRPSLSLRSSPQPQTEAQSCKSEAAMMRGLPASLVAEAYRSAAPQTLKQAALESDEASRSASQDSKIPALPRTKAILEASRRIAENRLLDVREEVGRLTCESEELEELISSIFEDLGTDDEGRVTLESFQASLCSDGDEHESMLRVSPEDAEKAFLQMTKGGQVLSYDQFKEESTIGLLHVLHRNLSARRTLRKKFRDYWF